MANITLCKFNDCIKAPNGANALQSIYQYLYQQFPALWKDCCPYNKNDVLYIHAYGSDESLVTFSMFVMWDFDMNPSNIQYGHFCAYVEPKTHQLLKLINMIEAEYPDECSEIQQYIDINREKIDKCISDVICKFINSKYTRATNEH